MIWHIPGVSHGDGCVSTKLLKLGLLGSECCYACGDSVDCGCKREERRKKKILVEGQGICRHRCNAPLWH